MSDPMEHERVYYRSLKNGQLAYLVRENGEDRLKWDNEGGELIDNNPDGTLKLGEFRLEVEARPILVAHAAMIAFEADKMTCRVIGEYGDSRRDWTALREKERLDFIDEGPDTKSRLRRDVWSAVMMVIRKHASA